MESSSEIEALGELAPAPPQPIEIQVVSQTLAQKMAQRPVTTAVICVLAGAKGSPCSWRKRGRAICFAIPETAA